MRLADDLTDNLCQRCFGLFIMDDHDDEECDEYRQRISQDAVEFLTTWWHQTWFSLPLDADEY